MKAFDTAKLQLTAYNFETEEKENITLNGLKAAADETTVLAVRDALNTLVQNQITLTTVIESYVIG